MHTLYKNIIEQLNKGVNIMADWKQKLLVTSAILGAVAPLVAPNEVEASKVYYHENVSTTNAGYYFATDHGELPLVLRMLTTHPDYEYYRSKGMHVNGNVYLYLQIYKDSMFYYSPIIRDKATKGKRADGSVNQLTRELLNRIEGTAYYPSYSQKEEQIRRNVPQYNYNPNPKDPIGNHPTYRNSQNSIARSIADLNHKRGNTDDHNFRRYTGKDMARHAWTPNSLTKTTVGYPSKHYDTYQQHSGTTKWGEYRSLGYYSSGINMSNPHFPADGMRRNGDVGFARYDLQEFPWTRSEHRGTTMHSEKDELAFQYAMHTNKMGLSPNGYNKTLYNRLYNKNTDWQAAREAYLVKRDAMTALYDESSMVRTNLARSANGGRSNRANAIEAMTVMYGSIQSEHLGYDQNVSVAFGLRTPSYRNGEVLWYTIVLTLPGEEQSNRVHDTRISRQEVLRGNQSLQVFTRNANGQTALNTTNAPEVEPGQTLKVVTDVTMVNPYRNALQGELNMQSNRGHRAKYRRNGGGNIRMNAANRFERTLVVPDQEGPLEILTWLDKDQYTRTFDMLWLNNANNAVNKLNVIVDRGDFIPERIDILDSNGNKVTNPVPGTSYQLDYLYRYVSDNGKDARRNTELRVDYNIGREMVGSPLHGRDVSGTKRTATRTVKPVHNGVYSLKSDFQMFETAQFDTDANLVVSAERYDQKPNNNRQADEWKSEYDLEVRNVRVLPSNSVSTHAQDTQSIVQFDVYYDVPSHVYSIGQDVNFLVNLDGKTVSEKHHVRKGLNRNLSTTMDVALEGGNQNLIATVLANSDKNVYETDIDTQENNVGTARAELRNSTIVPFRDSNKRVSWAQPYDSSLYNGVSNRYNTFNGLARDHLIFKTPHSQAHTNVNVYEQYQIDSVRFRSRMTRQEEMGENGDGWVELMKEDGFIRAGYGYELEIDVSYDTSAMDLTYTNRTGPNGQWSRPKMAGPILQDNIYVEMPDDAGTIRSVQGDGGTEQALRMKSKTGDGVNTKWTFEIDGGESLGTETVGRFYIGEDVADGRYPLNIFTPKIRGVNGKMRTSAEVLEHLLYDSANDLGIQVLGASTDDISDHINR